MADGGLLVALAHPDDESLIGGTMALCASRGVPVTILCATRGEVGEIAPNSGATPETLGEFRERELRTACEMLGVTDVRFLEYRDSGMDGTPENEDKRNLKNANAERVVDQIAAVIRDVRPAVVVTWDQSGGYGHPDHVAMHYHATAAFTATGSDDEGATSKRRGLYYSSIPVAEFVRVMMEMQKRGIVSGDAPGDREAMEALPRSEPNCIVDVSDQYDKKNAALRAHLTQLDTFGPFTNMPDDLARSFFSREYFYRAVPPLKDGEMLDDLFAQLA